MAAPITFDHSAHDPCWSVVLDDGSALTQGQGVLYQDLPYDRVKALYVTFGPHAYTFTYGTGQRPVYFSNVQMRLNPNNGTSTTRRVVCAGWQATVGGKNVKDLYWLYEDGSVHNGPDDPHEWRAEG